MALSIGIHGAILGALGIERLARPSNEEAVSTRLEGQTFDVDSVGDTTSGEVASAANLDAQSVAPNEGQPDIPSEELSAEPTPARAVSKVERMPERRPGSSPAIETNEDIKPKPADNDELGDGQPKPIPLASETRPSPHAPVDPFDLAQLPGQATNANASPGSSGSDSDSNSGAYGAKDVGATTVDVYATLLRQLPLAAKNDPVWSTLPEGDAGRIEFTIEVDKNGKVSLAHIVSDEQFPAPAHLKRAVPLAIRFFQHARVRLNTEGTPGSQRLALVATVHRRPADPLTPTAEGVRALGLKGGEPPTGVFFTYFTGHHIEMQMWRLP